MPIDLILYICFSHGIKMCICFGYNPQIIFVTFFSQIEFICFLAVNYYQDMNVLRIKFSEFLFCFMYLVSLTYWFIDSSYIKRQTLSGGGHKFSEFACFDLLLY